MEITSIPPGFSTGLIPRDYKSFPSGCYAGAPSFPDEMIIPSSQWPELLKEQKARQASLLHLRERHYDVLKSLDQDGLGLCWNFSLTKAVMYLQAIMGNPVLLSPWFNAGLINGWRDRGGWGSKALEQAIAGGIPRMEKCPEYRSVYDTQDTRDDAAKHKVTEWWDGSEDPDKNFEIMVSCHLWGLPTVCDYNDIAHSMCGCYIENLDPFVKWDDNSWSPSNGVKGLYKRSGRAARPNGLVIPRVTMVP